MVGFQRKWTFQALVLAFLQSWFSAYISICKDLYSTDISQFFQAFQKTSSSVCLGGRIVLKNWATLKKCYSLESPADKGCLLLLSDKDQFQSCARQNNCNKLSSILIGNISTLTTNNLHQTTFSILNAHLKLTLEGTENLGKSWMLVNTRFQKSYVADKKNLESYPIIRQILSSRRQSIQAKYCLITFLGFPATKCTSIWKCASQKYALGIQVSGALIEKKSFYIEIIEPWQI